MQIYLVGGAVRDHLLGIEAHEHDWVVVGSSPEEMIAMGFLPVGKEFPVFLHPETHDEYALARTERKTSLGYKGFEFYAAKEVTLEQDLARRDLTINAMAQDADGRLIDPFGGAEDLARKMFRHVSAAFEEDPVRILRIARLATKFTDFQVHPSTLQLMNNMVHAGEVDALVPERVWKELQRALENAAPIRFFEVLQACDALPVLFPEIGLQQVGMQRLAQTTLTDAKLRFAVLCHDIPVPALKNLLARLRIPNDYAELALLTAHHLTHFAHLHVQHAHELLTMIISCDGLRRPARFFEFLTVADSILEHSQQAKCNALRQCVPLLNQIDTQALQDSGLIGKDFAHALTELRVAALQQWIDTQSH